MNNNHTLDDNSVDGKMQYMTGATYSIRKIMYQYVLCTSKNYVSVMFEIEILRQILRKVLINRLLRGTDFWIYSTATYWSCNDAQIE